MRKKNVLIERMTLYDVAKMYYIDNKSQQEISTIIGVSRPQISKMLKEAREQNIVEISLNLPVDIISSNLENRLKEVLGISKVHIVMTDDIPKENYDKRLDSVTIFFASYLLDNMVRFKRIGLGWGRTLYQAILKLPFSSNHTDTLFMPLVGGAGMEPWYQTNSIIDRIAEKFKCDTFFINAPAFVLNPLVRQYISEKKNLGFEINQWEQLEVAYFSVGGSLRYSKSILTAISNDKIADMLINRGAIGDILGNFLNDEGNPVLSAEEAISVSIPLETLAAVPERVCIAIGEEKLELLTVAAKKGYITELITDSHTALQALKLFENTTEH